MLAMVEPRELSRASGMMWMKASPSMAPIAKETMVKIFFFRCCSLSDKVNTPTRDTKLTIVTAINAYMYGDIYRY